MLRKGGVAKTTQTPQGAKVAASRWKHASHACVSSRRSSSGAASPGTTREGKKRRGGNHEQSQRDSCVRPWTNGMSRTSAHPTLTPPEPRGLVPEG